MYIDRIDNSPSYPSGHTSSSRVLADVLSLVFPNRANDLHERADMIAFHRVEAGVHYPVDIENGKILAEKIFEALQKNKSLQADLASAQAEVIK